MANLLNQELLTSFGWSTCTHVQYIEHDGNQKFEKLSLELQDWQGWTSSKPPMLYLTLGEDSNPILQSSKFSVGSIVSISTETEMCMGVVLHYNREEDSYTVRGYTGQAQHYFDHKNSKTLTGLKAEQLCKAESREQIQQVLPFVTLSPLRSENGNSEGEKAMTCYEAIALPTVESMFAALPLDIDEDEVVHNPFQFLVYHLMQTFERSNHHTSTVSHSLATHTTLNGKDTKDSDGIKGEEKSTERDKEVWTQLISTGNSFIEKFKSEYPQDNATYSALEDYWCKVQALLMQMKEDMVMVAKYAGIEDLLGDHTAPDSDVHTSSNSENKGNEGAGEDDDLNLDIDGIASEAISTQSDTPEPSMMISTILLRLDSIKALLNDPAAAILSSTGNTLKRAIGTPPTTPDKAVAGLGTLPTGITSGSPNNVDKGDNSGPQSQEDAQETADTLTPQSLKVVAERLATLQHHVKRQILDLLLHLRESLNARFHTAALLHRFLNTRFIRKLRQGHEQLQCRLQTIVAQFTSDVNFNNSTNPTDASSFSFSSWFDEQQAGFTSLVPHTMEEALEYMKAVLLYLQATTISPGGATDGWNSLFSMSNSNGMMSLVQHVRSGMKMTSTTLRQTSHDLTTKLQTLDGKTAASSSTDGSVSLDGELTFTVLSFKSLLLSLVSHIAASNPLLSSYNLRQKLLSTEMGFLLLMTYMYNNTTNESGDGGTGGYGQRMSMQLLGLLQGSIPRPIQLLLSQLLKHGMIAAKQGPDDILPSLSSENAQGAETALEVASSFTFEDILMALDRWETVADHMVGHSGALMNSMASLSVGDEVQMAMAHLKCLDKGIGHYTLDALQFTKEALPEVAQQLAGLRSLQYLQGHGGDVDVGALLRGTLQTHDTLNANGDGDSNNNPLSSLLSGTGDSIMGEGATLMSIAGGIMVDTGSRSKLLSALREKVLDFLLSFIPTINISSLDGIYENISYAVSDMDLSGFDFDKDKVLLEMSESHMEYLQERWQDITRYDTPTTAEDDKGTATTSGKRSDDNDSLFRFAAQHISCSFSDVNWKYEQLTFPHFKGAGSLNASIDHASLGLAFTIARVPKGVTQVLNGKLSLQHESKKVIVRYPTLAKQLQFMKGRGRYSSYSNEDTPPFPPSHVNGSTNGNSSDQNNHQHPGLPPAPPGQANPWGPCEEWEPVLLLKSADVLIRALKIEVQGDSMSWIYNFLGNLFKSILKEKISQSLEELIVNKSAQLLLPINGLVTQHWDTIKDYVLPAIDTAVEGGSVSNSDDNSHKEEKKRSNKSNLTSDLDLIPICTAANYMSLTGFDLDTQGATLLPPREYTLKVRETGSLGLRLDILEKAVAVSYKGRDLGQRDKGGDGPGLGTGSAIHGDDGQSTTTEDTMLDMQYKIAHVEPGGHISTAARNIHLDTNTVIGSTIISINGVKVRPLARDKVKKLLSEPRPLFIRVLLDPAAYQVIRDRAVAMRTVEGLKQTPLKIVQLEVTEGSVGLTLKELKAGKVLVVTGFASSNESTSNGEDELCTARQAGVEKGMLLLALNNTVIFQSATMQQMTTSLSSLPRPITLTFCQSPDRVITLTLVQVHALQIFEYENLLLIENDGQDGALCETLDCGLVAINGRAISGYTHLQGVLQSHLLEASKGQKDPLGVTLKVGLRNYAMHESLTQLAERVRTGKL